MPDDDPRFHAKVKSPDAPVDICEVYDREVDDGRNPVVVLPTGPAREMAGAILDVVGDG